MQIGYFCFEYVCFDKSEKKNETHTYKNQSRPIEIENKYMYYVFNVENIRFIHYVCIWHIFLFVVPIEVGIFVCISFEKAQIQSKFNQFSLFSLSFFYCLLQITYA